jgi:hypothetical protein
MRTMLRPAAWVVVPSLVAGLLAGPAAARQPGPAADPTIVLTPRPAPWTIAEVRARFPAALATGGPSTLLLGQSLFVARGPGSRSGARTCVGCGC